MRMRVLMVCLGNICRSPTAEAALREALADAGFDGEVEVDSAGTGDWHVGSPPDPRMAAAARAQGLEISGAARQVTVDDFAEFDLLVAMDRQNADDLRRLAPTVKDRERVRLLRSFEDSPDGEDVPDPYFGDDEGFADVVAIARAGARGLTRWLQAGRGA